ncbi:MAG: isoprenyl transferase [Candidatus Omnitrophota bacterium]|nr:MAG: isoprenyl transferase [Candidatus Omnitrophota bacterium]
MGKINRSKFPHHVAIIMDGNGRWARRRLLPKIAGHKAGIKSVEKIIKAAKELGIKILTLYTFSTENWKRPKKEIDALMRLLENYLDNEIERIAGEGVRIRAIGRITALPSIIQLKLKKAEARTVNNKDIFVNLALNYGARAEIVDATKKIARCVKQNELNPEDISENKFSDYLYTAGLPDPDILIRTSGEMRVSNFLLWQISYTEIYITKKLWPDFRKKDLERAVIDCQERDRRYGG